MKTSTSNRLAALLLLLGSSAMIGHIINQPALKGLGLASHFAPYPKVFCQAHTLDGNQPFETFAAEFTLHYSIANGKRRALQITPEVYSRVKGPYNRRNVYGAVLAYGPALPPEINEATLHYALQNPGHIVEELALPADAYDFVIEIKSRTAGSTDRWLLDGKEVRHEH